MALDARGFVQVDAQRRTDEPTIYAIGDVTGEPMLAHKAAHEGRVAAEAVAGEKTAFEPQAIPAVVFTDPEIAWCGLTESEARDQERDVTIARFPWAASGRALTLGQSDGVTKLVIDPETERVLGVGIAGSGAGRNDCRGRAGGRDGRPGFRPVTQHPSAPDAVREHHGGRGRLFRPQHPRVPPAPGRLRGAASDLPAA